MTPNEKAATFIGWDPVWRIPPEDHRLYGRDGEPMQRRDPMPDMTDPRNYMKALEAVVALGFTVELYGELEPPAFPWGCAIKHPTVVTALHDAETPAEAVVVALSQVYDAEHPAEAEAHA